MTYTFDAPMTEEDFVEFNMYHTSQSALVKRNLLIARLIGPIVFILAGGMFTYVTGDIVAVIVFAIVAILWLMFYPRYAVRSMRRRVTKFIREGDQGELFGDRIIVFSDQGIEADNAGARSNFLWHHVTKIAEGNEAFYVYVSNVQAVVIPFRLFEDNEEKKQFQSYVANRIEV